MFIGLPAAIRTETICRRQALCSSSSKIRIHVTVKMRNNNLSKPRDSKTHLCAVHFTASNLNVQFNPYQFTEFEMHELLNLCKIGISLKNLLQSLVKASDSNLKSSEKRIGMFHIQKMPFPLKYLPNFWQPEV